MVIPSPSRRARPLRALLAFTLLVALAGLIVLLTLRYVQVGEVRVPEVIGQDAAQASRTLAGLGFEVSTYTEANEGMPGGVTSQTPEAGTLVRQGRGISLGIGAAALGGVPNVVGLTEAEATEQLGSRGLSVTDVRYEYAPQEAGVVLEQVPAPSGALAQPGGGSVGREETTAGGTAGGTEVALSVSRGPPPEQLEVPDLVGRRVPEARRQLGALGFRRVEVIPTRLGPPGVIAQLPEAGEAVPLGAQITLYTTVSNPQVVRVPPVIGLPAEVAARRLSAAGLRLGPLEETPFDPARPRGVVSAVPADYTLWGSPVVLTVNGAAGTLEPREPAPPVARTGEGANAGFGVQPGAGQPGTGRLSMEPGATSDPFSAPPLQEQSSAAGALPAVGGREIPIDYNPANYGFLRGRAYAFRVEVTDEVGERVAIDRQMNPDEPVEDTVVVYGEAELRMYIDGQIVLAYNPPTP